MSIKAKINYKETYCDVPIELDYEDTEDLCVTGMLKPILARVHELIDFSEDKKELRRKTRLRRFGKYANLPYVAASMIAIGHIQDLFLPDVVFKDLPLIVEPKP